MEVLRAFVKCSSSPVIQELVEVRSGGSSLHTFLMKNKTEHFPPTRHSFHMIFHKQLFVLFLLIINAFLSPEGIYNFLQLLLYFW